MDTRIAQTIAIIDANLERPLSVPALAELVRLSPSRFAHLFRAQVGASPRLYIRTLRLIRASLLLRYTHLTVKEILVEVGYVDASRFSRDFKRQYGAPPRRWRVAGESLYRTAVRDVAALAKS